MPEDTSPSTGATPAPGPVTGQNATSGATPSKPAVTLEEALARIADLEHSSRNATEEVERHRKKLTAFEKKEAEAAAAQKAAEEAQLSEIERVKKQFTAVEQQLAQTRQQLVLAHVKLAAKEKGIIDPDLAALAIRDTLELDADGMPTNLEKALESLIKHKPYLVPQEAAPAPTTSASIAGPVPVQAPALPAMNPPRTSIAPPNTLPPGQVPSWSDIFKRP